MCTFSASALRSLLLLALTTVLAACAPAPIYKTHASFVAATPEQVATSPDNFAEAEVVWGGEVIGVHNLPDRTRIEVLAYPLDGSQRPRLKEPPAGRFLAEVPGFIDPMNFPPGSLVTMRGEVTGTRTEPVGGATYVYPLLRVQAGDFHRWTPEEMRQGHSNIRFGVGVGVGIR